MKITSKIKFLVIVAVLAVSAQQTFALTNEETTKAKEELREHHHRYIRRDLELTRDQENAFFREWDKKEDEIQKVNDETRALEKKIINNANASDVELEAAARQIFEQKKKEAEIELVYFEKFKAILSPRQLVRLKQVERMANLHLLKEQQKNKRAAKK